MRRSIDKRNQNRISSLNFKIDYRVIGSDYTDTVGIINLSGGGLCFLRNSTISKGDEISIKFPLQSKTFVLMGKVARVDGREVAVKFTDTEVKIEKFINAFNNEYSYQKKEETSSEGILSRDSVDTERKSKPENTDNDMLDIDIEASGQSKS